MSLMGRIYCAAFGLALVALAGVSAPAAAATLPATSANLIAQLAAAKPGDTVVATGDLGTPTLANYSRSPAVTLDMRQASMMSGVLKQVTGLHVLGGKFTPKGQVTVKSAGALVYGYSLMCADCTDVAIAGAAFVGPESAQPGLPYVPGDGYGFQVVRGAKISVTGSTFAGFKVGLTLGAVDGFTVDHNDFAHMRADGLDVAQSWHGTITYNDCHETRIVGAEHPDCIQLWSRPDLAPTSDILIAHNNASGPTQGFSGFNHVRLQPPGFKTWNGPALTVATDLDDGGFDRITAEDNELWISAPEGIGLVNCRDCIVRNNHVHSLTGALYQAQINLSKSPGTLRCGNTVDPGGAGKKGSTDDPCNPAPAAPVTPDTRDAQIAGLTVQASKLTADLAAAVQAASDSATAMAQATAERDAAQAKAEATAARFAALLTGLQDLAATAAAPAP